MSDLPKKFKELIEDFCKEEGLLYTVRDSDTKNHRSYHIHDESGQISFSLVISTGLEKQDLDDKALRRLKDAVSGQLSKMTASDALKTVHNFIRLIELLMNL